MGKFRSKSGCLTCRSRRVKCDEVRPVCGQCGKKNRPCQWEAPHTKFKGYEPTVGLSGATTDGGDDDELMDIEGEEIGVGRGESSLTEQRRNIRPDHRPDPTSDLASTTPSSVQQSPASPFQDSRSSTGGISITGVLRPYSQSVLLSTPQAVTLDREQALLVHYYVEHLGRWLDCTDASRQFTRRVPDKVKECPILLNAVLSFASRHRRDDITANLAYQRCITLLIDRLNLNSAPHDDSVLCAIVILRFFEQLNVPSGTGSDEEQHLAGTAAILRASQGQQNVDPSAPTLREAAFWVYVRQCLYNATIDQQPPDIDFSLVLHPDPASMHDSHPLAQMRLETAWANQMTWYCASVVNFCFDGTDPHVDRTRRLQRWQELWDTVQVWHNDRPANFDPIWAGLNTDTSVFPEIYFTSDWHLISFGFYHFSCILLLSYKPGPKFAIRNVGGRLTDSDHQILDHARAICGSCKSAPSLVPSLVTLCHTIFIWGPLLSGVAERNEVIYLLTSLEATHGWPTAWIINALREEWGLE